MTTSPTFLGHGVATVLFRPRPFGYIVANNSMPDLQRAVRYASSEWGGMYQPIVAVEGATLLPQNNIFPLALDTLLSRAEFWIISDTIPRGQRDRLSDQLRVPLLSWDELTPGEEPGLDVLGVVSTGSLASSTIYVPPADASVLDILALGERQNPVDPYIAQLLEETGVTLLAADTGSKRLGAQLSQSSLLGLTARHVHAHVAEARHPALILFCDDSPSFADLLAFWNSRALCGPWHFSARVAFCSPHTLEDLQAIASIRVAASRSLFASDPDLVVICRDTNIAAINATLTNAGFASRPSLPLRWRFSARGRDLERDPITFAFNAPLFLFMGGATRMGLGVQSPVLIAKPSVPVRVDSPIPFNMQMSGFVRVDITGLPMLDWPHSPGLTSAIADSASPTDDGISFLRTPAKQYEFSLTYLDGPDALTAVLQDRGLSWSYSDKGQYCSALMSFLGADAQAGLELISTRSVQQVFRAMESVTWHKARSVVERAVGTAASDAAVSELLAAIVPATVPQWLSANELSSKCSMPEPQIVRLLHEALRRRLVRRGFRFDCPACNLRSVVALGDERDLIECPGCGSTAPLLGPSNQEPRLVYAINSLLDRTLGQDCIGHLIVMRHLQHTLGLVWAAPGAIIDASDCSFHREADLLGVSKRELLLTEVKQSGRLDEAELIRFLELAKRVQPHRAIFATVSVADDWPTGTRDFVSEAREAGFPLEFLHGDTLFYRDDLP